MFNHLKNESSPYLKQHADNSINWYPWGEEALTKAKLEHKSIFLSIGYSSSHWCEVMNKESFQNEKIAELLNERFIAIKVDKEERPDIEKYYQKVYSLMNRRTAGSPLTIFMTENLEPFYAATYVSLEAKREEFGFEELLRSASKKYITEYETLVERGSEILQNINPKEQSIEATKLTLDIIKTIGLHTENLLDKKNGGFGSATKFPNVSTLNLLLDCYELTKDETLLKATLLSLDMMAKGEIYDHINGGFYRYSSNDTWSLPHKVKTTYDNALLSQLYLRAYQITDNKEYKNVAFKTIDFMLKHMSDERLFFAKTDETQQETTTDKTTITSWNAMMISTLFKASVVNEKYKTLAIESLETLLNKVYINQTLYRNTVLKIEGFLEDYAYLGETLIEAYKSTDNDTYLLMATEFSNRLIERFYAYGQWNFSSGSFKIKAETHDSDYPSSLATAISLLMSLSSLVDTTYKKFVFNTLELNSYNIMRQPLSSPKLTQITLRYLKDDIIFKTNLKEH